MENIIALDSKSDSVFEGNIFVLLLCKSINLQLSFNEEQFTFEGILHIFVHAFLKFDVKSDKPKVEKKAKSSMVSSGGKMLADISNISRISSTLTQDSKSRPNSSTVKEYIEQLLKENAALMKLSADKDRIIDISGAELQKLRITLQKMQQQNLHLAQSNTQMLSELNSVKDRLKDVQHQLGCKNGLLIANKLELEVSVLLFLHLKEKVSEQEDIEVHMVAERGKDQHCNTNGRQKSKSESSFLKVQEKSAGDNARLRARRQSARFKHDEPKPAEESFHSDEMDDKMLEDDVAFSVKKEEDSLPNKDGEESRRLSVSRPSRVVAKKVQSYREISLNVKMRRPE
ncbi:hypothetical protein SSX86_010661 [Deinandra increscens subsp. villosa]|uniref:Shugoshin C-terminal domain-containing protein n=1 Tax=Deinandra increscens subsp. villosa TaxID=3103831 RepID=A0AAP0H2R4_9ASTR